MIEFFFFLCTVCLHVWKLCGCKKITVLQQQINLLICLFFVQLSALVELDIQEGYLTRNLVWLAGDNFVVLNLLPWTKKVQNNHSDICIEWSCDHFGGMSPENCYLGTKMNSLNFWAHFLLKSRYKSSITWGLYFILPSFYSVFLIEQFFLKFPVVKPLDKYCTSNSWFFSNILGVMLFFFKPWKGDKLQAWSQISTSISSD